MEPTPFMKWIAEQQKQGNLPDTELVAIDGKTVVRDGEIVEGQADTLEIVRQAAEFSLSQPELVEQIKHSPQWQNEEVRHGVITLLKSWRVSTTTLAHLEEQS